MSEQKLLGMWASDPADHATLESVGCTTMEFLPDQRLVYTIHDGSHIQGIFMTFRLDGNVIVSDQPSAPGEQRTEFVLADDNRLGLSYDGGAWSWYVRVPGSLAADLTVGRSPAADVLDRLDTLWST
jgi:hypothetical protein